MPASGVSREDKSPPTEEEIVKAMKEVFKLRDNRHHKPPKYGHKVNRFKKEGNIIK